MDKIFSIVVADDDLDDQDLIAAAFREAKVKVVVNAVFDGIQLMDFLLGINQFKGRRFPDLVFLDLNMPLMDGFDALKQLRQYPQLQTLPVYILTTSKDEADKKKALELGATGFYTKGASSKDIRKIVESICVECFSS
jgi:CheY-like chemotaxis protein